MLHFYEDKKEGKSYKSVSVRLDLDGKLNQVLSSISVGEGIGKKNLIEAILTVTINDDDYFSQINPFRGLNPQDIYEGYCSVGVSIRLDAYLNYRMSNLSKKTGIHKKKLLILVLDQFSDSKAVIDAAKSRLTARVR
ncbi:hypothetical protein VV404_004591 [Salmonella enterica]|nr:hypothetical protein [Salmonella enterica]EMD7527380.1 hypothetical protein [Salmonella enterica]